MFFFAMVQYILFLNINITSHHCNISKPIQQFKATLASSHLLCRHYPPFATGHPRIVGRERRIVSTLKQVRELTAALERIFRVLAQGSKKANLTHRRWISWNMILFCGNNVISAWDDCPKNLTVQAIEWPTLFCDVVDSCDWGEASFCGSLAVLQANFVSDYFDLGLSLFNVFTDMFLFVYWRFWQELHCGCRFRTCLLSQQQNRNNKSFGSWSPRMSAFQTRSMHWSSYSYIVPQLLVKFVYCKCIASYCISNDLICTVSGWRLWQVYFSQAVLHMLGEHANQTTSCWECILSRHPTSSHITASAAKETPPIGDVGPWTLHWQPLNFAHQSISLMCDHATGPVPRLDHEVLFDYSTISCIRFTEGCG